MAYKRIFGETKGEQGGTSGAGSTTTKYKPLFANKKTEAPVVETKKTEVAPVKIETKKPAEQPTFKSASSVKTVPEKKSGIFENIAKAVLPRSLEVKFGLTQPNQVEQMKAANEANMEESQIKTRKIETETNLAKEGVKAGEFAQLPEGYKEPTSLVGIFQESLSRGYHTSLAPAIGYSAEAISNVFPELKNLKEWGQDFGDKESAYIYKHPELLPDTNVKGFFEGGAKDPKWYAQTLGELLPVSATMVGMSVIGGLTGGPAGAGILGTSSIFLIEQGNAYKQMIDAGVSPDKAGKASSVYASIATIVERGFGFDPVKVALGSTGPKIISTNFKEFLKKELPRYSLSFLNNILQEGGEEGVQQFAQNITNKWLAGMKDQGIWDGVLESIPAGALGGLAFGGADVIGKGVQLIKNIKGKEGVSAEEAKVETPIETPAPEETPPVAEAPKVIEVKSGLEVPEAIKLNIESGQAKTADEWIGSLKLDNPITQDYSYADLKKFFEITRGNIGYATEQLNENIVKARDEIIALQKKLNCFSTPEAIIKSSDNRIAFLNKDVQEYVDAYKETVDEYNNEDGTNLYSIEIVKFPDGKYSYGLNISSSTEAYNIPIQVNNLTKTREQAIKAAKQYALAELQRYLDNPSLTAEDKKNINIAIADLKDEVPVIEKIKKTPFKKGKKVEEAVVLTEKDKEVIKKYHQLFVDYYTIYENIPESEYEYVGEAEDIALKEFFLTHDLNDRQKQFFEEMVGYMPEALKELDYFTEWASNPKILEKLKDIEANPDIVPLDEYRFEPAELPEGKILYTEVGDIVIDRDGVAHEIVNANDEYIKEGGYAGDYNSGYVRMKQVGEEKDYLGYTNQLRQATQEEIDKLGLDKKAKEQVLYDSYESKQEKVSEEEKPSKTMKGSQKTKVAEAIKGEAKTIKQIAEETKILEPNVRRILGVGAKEGTFERVDKGIYILKKNGKQLAYIETGNAIESLPRMAKEGVKVDMVFLDIPYKTPAVIGGNRGIKYDYITVDEFGTVANAIKDIVRYGETPVFYMYSQARSGEKEMQKYTDKMIEAGFTPIAKGEYTKLQKDGITRVRNMRGDIIEPEGIILFTKSGTTNLVNPDLTFKLIRPRGYQTEKPAEMLKALIEMSTEEGEVILDPFAGSGVTGEQAIKAGRSTIAIEKSEKAVEEHIKPRFAKASKEIEAKDYKTIEAETLAYAKENKDTLIKEYENQFGNFLGGDNIKELFPAYRADRTKYLAFREGGNYIWNATLDNWLETRKGQASNEVLVMIGGPAVGKSTAAKATIGKDFTDRYAFVIETTGHDKVQFDRLKQRIIDNGFGLHVVQVYADIDTSFKRTLDRAQQNGGANDGKGRTVFIPEYVKRQLGAIDIGKEMTVQTEDNVHYNLIVNQGKPEDATFVEPEQALAILDKIKYNKGNEEELIKKYYEQTIQSLEQGTISEAVFNGTTGLLGSPEEVSYGKRQIDNSKPQARSEGRRENIVEKPTPRFAKKKVVSKTKLIKPIEAIKKVSTNKSNLPILEEFRVEDGKMYATDLEVAVNVKTDLKNGMYKVVGKEPIPTSSTSEDFPVVPEKPTEIFAKIDNTLLTKALKNSSLFISKNPIRPELNGTFVSVKGNTIRVRSTDAFRLYQKTFPAKVSTEGEYILSNVKKTADILPVLDTPLELRIDPKEYGYFNFSSKEGDIFVKKTEGQYPDVDEIIPQYTKITVIDRAEAIKVLKELKPFVKEFGDFNEAVEVEEKDGKLNFTVGNEKTKTLSISMKKDSVKTEAGGMPDGAVVMPIRGDKVRMFNINYLIDALSVLEENEANMYTVEDINFPVLFTDNGLWNVQPKEVEKKKEVVPSGYASAGGDKLGNFEKIVQEENSKENQMKIYDRVKGLIEKYAKTIGEGYLPRRALGVYYRDTQNIRISGMNNLSVAAHEITHFLDFAYNISKEIMGVEDYSISGKPIYDPKTAKLRKELTDVYTTYYGGARKTHKLEKRMVEGFATLLEKYIEQPTFMTAQYPNVVNAFLKEGGMFYKPVMGDIIKDLRAIVAEYQGLDPLDKIGARIANDEINTDKESFLNIGEKIKTEVADNLYPIEKLAKMTGTHFTSQDASLWARQYNNVNSLVINNIKGDKGYWGWRDGEIKRLHAFNWKDIINNLQKDKTVNEFSNYLVARREYFSYQELKTIKENVSDAKKVLLTGQYAIKEARDAGASEEELAELYQGLGEVKARYNGLVENMEELEKVLKNDGFTEEEVSEAYLQNRVRFSDFEKMYDMLVAEDLKFLNDSQVQLISNDEYKSLANQEGYASFKRAFYDEIAGEEQANISRIKVGKTKVSSMLRRKGSQRAIINPLFSALTNHAEITKKGMKQIIYNKVGGLAPQLPDLFQRQQLKVFPDTNGRFVFPQEKDPNILMTRVGYKRVPFLVDKLVKRTLDETLNPQNISIFEQIILGASRFFTKGTTGLFPGFALTNFTVDQISASAQSRNGYTPIYDSLTKLSKAMDVDNIANSYFREYMVMGGERQTFVGWQDMSPNELFNAIKTEKHSITKAIEMLNTGMDILALPSKASEILTRATEYVKSRMAGKSSIVALEEAGRVSAPFHHIGRLGGGRIGQTVIKSIPFFNPGIQVLSQAAESLETPEARKRYLFVALAVTAASIASLGLLMATGTDDQKKLYADIHPDELNKYIWLPSPDGKSLIKIRVPDQMAVVATLVNMLWADKTLQANYKAGEYINASMAWLPAQFDISQPAKMLMAWIPQIIKPAILTAVGMKDFPKIMPLESQSQTNKLPSQRFTEATSPVAKKLGELLNLSPIKIDYLLTGYLGRATGFLTGKPGVYNPLKSMSRDYYFESGRKLQEFYDMKEVNDQEYKAYKDMTKKFPLGESTRILKKHAQLKIINNLISDYRDIDPDKYPLQAKKYRDIILQQLNKL